ncbi:MULTISPECIES: hypothetical protein [Sphingobacterium]|uniref:DUF4625 domain-containing protein n=1 Tax=Sphingobacterium tenebrionis TaxID=3111775 RepID=A0ABU8I8L0_9SPHI|nr:hypothetical protein [Sphingobacterium sp. CZ-2]QBR11558.1 hypothetical protein E3D81_04955 [Sphingobacterium sp. CZ-2]
MKNIHLFIIALFSISVFSSCSKDDPNPEVDQEEVSGATLVFTEVKKVVNGSNVSYEDIAGAEVEKIEFKGNDLLPEVGAHLHLEKDKSYRFNLIVRDFAGRESQQTFVARDDQHFAFILGAPADALSISYADKKADGTAVKVGTVGHISVNQVAESFTFNYILRHLNPGVKSQIDLDKDITNKEYTKFGGANDLDLKFSLHLVEEDDHGHDH